MKIIKEKIIAIFGAVSASLGAIGAAIVGFGLCACVWAPLFSVAGIFSIVMGVLSNNKIYLLVIGFVLLLISFILYRKKKTCKKHRKT